MKQWRVPRPLHDAGMPARDPADCGTAWGLELSVPTSPRAAKRSTRAGGRRKRVSTPRHEDTRA